MNGDGSELERGETEVRTRSKWFVRRDESGLVLVWTSLFLMVLLGFAALAVDLGHAYYVAQKAQNAVDAAALAGAIYLPGDASGAHDEAQSLATANGFTDGADNVQVTAVQGADPAQMVVTVTQDVPTWFGRAIGFKSMHVSRTATAVASQPSTTPYDLVLIIDRTGSMSAADLANVKAASKDLLGVLDPSRDSVALGTLGPSSTTNGCTAGGTTGAIGLHGSTATGSWMAAPFPATTPLNDYQNPDGSLNTASQIVKSINCLDTSSVGTDLGTPLQAAQAYLDAYGRPGTQRGIILMTDGEANQPNTQSCKWAANAATAVKADGIDLVTIGFGISGLTCPDAASPAPSPYVGSTATKVLADMASPTNGVAATDNGCTDAENQDGDNFFCEPKSADLSSVFITAATKLTNATPRLIK